MHTGLAVWCHPAVMASLMFGICLVAKLGLNSSVLLEVSIVIASHLYRAKLITQSHTLTCRTTFSSNPVALFMQPAAMMGMFLV